MILLNIDLDLSQDDPKLTVFSSTLRVTVTSSKTAFTRCRHIFKTMKNVTDRPTIYMKMAHFLPADFENGRF